MRPSSRHDGAFSSRDSVGWLIRSSPVSDKRAAGQLERRIETQCIKVVAILIATGDGEHARPDHVGVAVGGARRVAFVGHAGGQQVGNPEPPLDHGKQQDAAVRRQPPAVEPGAQLLARNG